MTETSFKKYIHEVFGHANQLLSQRFFDCLSSKILRFLNDRQGGIDFFEYVE
jgi:hypothetical protein